MALKCQYPMVCMEEEEGLLADPYIVVMEDRVRISPLLPAV